MTARRLRARVRVLRRKKKRIPHSEFASVGMLRDESRLRTERRPLFRRKSICEKCRTDQDEDQRRFHARQRRAMDESQGTAQPPPRLLVGLLRLWIARRALQGRRSPRLRTRKTLPREATQGLQPRNATILQLALDTTVGLTMKPVGMPDAGNPHVRSDERRRETGRWPISQATAPFFDSTRSKLAALRPFER